MLNALEAFMQEQQPAPRKRKATTTTTPAAAAEPTKKKEIMADHFSMQPKITLQSSTTADGCTNVLRYGKIYKRKKPSYSLGMSGLQCPPGQRYCTHCKGFQPLEKFYTTAKRYICRAHHYQRVQEHRKHLKVTIAREAWLQLSRWNFVVGRQKTEYSVHDIADIFHTCMGLSEKPDWTPFVVPIDPEKPLRPDNVAVVSNEIEALLYKLYLKTNSRGLHIAFVQAQNQIPRNADIRDPCNPFVDPNFQRQDMDAAEILRKEIEQGNLMRPFTSAASEQQ